MRYFFLLLSFPHILLPFEDLSKFLLGAGAAAVAGISYVSNQNNTYATELKTLTDEHTQLQIEHEQLKDSIRRSGMLIRGVHGIHLCNPLNTLFNKALEDRDEDGFNALLRLAKNFDINGLDENGTTALHIATRYKNKPLIKMLTAMHAHPNAPDVFTMTPLHYAAQANDIEMMSCLIGQGADPNARNARRQTPLMVALEANKREATEFLIAIKHARAESDRAPSPDHCASLMGSLQMAIDRKKELMASHDMSPEELTEHSNILSLIFHAFLERNPECLICYNPVPNEIFITKCCEKGLCRDCAHEITKKTGAVCAFCRQTITLESFLTYTRNSPSRPASPDDSSSHAASSVPA